MKTNSSTASLVVIIICNDERNDAWTRLLMGRVSSLYSLKAGRCRRFEPDDPDGLSMRCSQLPKKVDAVLFHSSDIKLWRELIEMESSYTFEFNTPGTHQVRDKNKIIPIYRQTYSSFDIKSEDIDELIEFISGKRELFPAMCQPPIKTPDLLPALATLCQSYLGSKEMETSQATQPQCWLDSLGLLQRDQIDQLAYQKATEQLDIELKISQKRYCSSTSLEKLFSSLFIGGYNCYKAPAQTIPQQLVAHSYCELEAILNFQSNLASSERLVAESLGFSSIEFVFAVRGSYVGLSTAAVLANGLGVKRQILEAEVVDTIINLPHKSILIISDSQISVLPALRLNGFAGAVLILSDKSFPELKQGHRVLRFGQGSHDALPVPFTLAELYAKVDDLVPMEPENLVLFQNEMKAVQNIYEKKIVPWLEKIGQPDVDLTIATKKIDAIIKQVKSETPVACHTVVTIENESLHLEDRSLQIQRHLYDAFRSLERRDSLSTTVLYLTEIFSKWYALVQAAAGENLKPVS